MLKAIICDATKWVNMFPQQAIIPNIPLGFLHTGLSTDVKIQCCVPLGSYWYVYDKPDPFNTNTPQTTETISLHGQGNLQG